MKTAIKFGVYYFIASALVTLIQYLINPELLFRPAVSLVLSLLVVTAFMVLLLKEEKKVTQPLTFGEGIKNTMVMYIIGSFFSIIFAYVLYNFIDPSLIERSIEYAQKIARSTAERVAEIGGLSEVDKVEMLEEMEKQQVQSNPFTLSGLLLSWAINIIFPGLVLSLIISAIMKDKKSDQEESLSS